MRAREAQARETPVHSLPHTTSELLRMLRRACTHLWHSVSPAQGIHTQAGVASTPGYRRGLGCRVGGLGSSQGLEFRI